MTSQINGKLWHDLNGNGFQDTFEPGIAGGTVYLDDNQNGIALRGTERTSVDPKREQGTPRLRSVCNREQGTEKNVLTCLGTAISG